MPLVEMTVLRTMDGRLVLFCSVEDQTQIPVLAGKHSTNESHPQTPDEGFMNLPYYIQIDTALCAYSS